MKTTALLLLLVLLQVAEKSASAEANYFGAHNVVIPRAKVSSSSIACYRNVPGCIPLAIPVTTTTGHFQCLDVTLPYKNTYLPVSISPSSPSQPTDVSLNATTTTSDDTLASFEAIAEHLSTWNGLRAIPQCWKALQYLLCASFFPKCTGTQILLPTVDMCTAVRSHCRLVEQYYHWPSWLDCHNATLFSKQSSRCTNDYKDIKLSSSSGAHFKCSPPLVSTDEPKVWYPGVDGCALRCTRNPLYSAGQQKTITRIINYGCFLGLLVTGFGVLTFAIGNDFSRTSRYPSTCIFYVNVCLFVSYLGWMMQHFGSFAITCRPDNTVRHSVQDGHALCFASFSIIYYFSLAALHWLVLFSYGCSVAYQPKGSSAGLPSDRLRAKKTSFYLIAWVLPFVWTLVIVLIGEIDGDALYGICFVGFANSGYFVAFAIVPATAGITAFSYFMGKSLNGLRQLLAVARKDQNDINRCSRKCTKIRYVMVRMYIALLWSLLIYLTAIAVYFYQQSLTADYTKQLHQSLVCNLNLTDALEPKQSHSRYPTILESTDLLSSPTQLDCQSLEPKPSLWPLVLQLSLIFSNCFLALIWISTSSTFRSWKHFLERRFEPEYYQQQSKETLKRLHEAEEEAEATGVQLNADEQKRRKTGGFRAKLAGHRRRWDPVEIDLTSITSQSWAATFKDKLFGRRSSNARAVVASTSISMAPTTTADGSDDVGSELHSSVTLESTNSYQFESSKRNRRKVRNNKKFIIRNSNLRRRGSDTSGSLASTAFSTAAKGTIEAGKSVTKSTSTSDLFYRQTTRNLPRSVTPVTQQQAYMQLLTPNLTPFAMPHGMMTAVSAVSAITSVPQQFSHNLNGLGSLINTASAVRPPGLWQSQATFAAPSGINAIPVRFPPAQFSSQPVHAAPPLRPPLECSSSFTFTHGFSDQCPAEFTNPLTQIRRPDSRQGTTSTQAGGSSNCIIQPAFASHGPAVFNPNAPFAHHYQAPFAFPSCTYYNAQLADDIHLEIAKQQLTSAAFESLKAERDALKCLVTGRSDSAATNTNVLLPMLHSDSEFSLYDDASGSRGSNYPDIVTQCEVQQKKIIQEVEERMQMVEGEDAGLEEGEEKENESKNVKKKEKKKRKKVKDTTTEKSTTK